MHWGTFTLLIVAQLFTMLMFAAISGRLKILLMNLHNIIQENDMSDQPILELKAQIVTGIETNLTQIRSNLSTTGLLFAMIIISLITYLFGVPAFPIPLWVGVSISLYLMFLTHRVLNAHDYMLALATNFNIMVFAHNLDEMSRDSESELNLDKPAPTVDEAILKIKQNIDSDRLEL